MKPLITVLDEEKWKIRLAAVRTLGLLKDSRAVEPLIARLIDKGEMIDIRCAAAWELGYMQYTQATEPLIATLEWINREREYFRENAAYSGKWNGSFIRIRRKKNRGNLAAK